MFFDSVEDLESSLATELPSEDELSASEAAGQSDLRFLAEFLIFSKFTMFWESVDNFLHSNPIATKYFLL